jgi:hypothetical protein
MEWLAGQLEVCFEQGCRARFLVVQGVETVIHSGLAEEAYYAGRSGWLLKMKVFREPNRMV